MNTLRARALRLPLQGRPGPLNLITDVAGVEVATLTIVDGHGPLRRGHGPVRTGVTVVLPRGRRNATDACAAATFALNGNGEMTGSHWIAETGALTTPIALTNSHAIGECHRAVVDWCTNRHPELSNHWIMPLVGETFDGYLNDINGHHIHRLAVIDLLDSARPGPFPLGSVGGGTGMACYEFKGGTGSASRVVAVGASRYTVGVLVQANFGARRELTIAGRHVGPALAEDNPMDEDPTWLLPPGAGSVIAVVATDAPLTPHQCAALARRVPLGLARTGTTGSHFSGDLFAAFSTANRGALNSRVIADTSVEATLDTTLSLPWGFMDDLYAAVVQAVEEAVLDSIIGNRTMIGRDGHRVPGLPVDSLASVCAEPACAAAKGDS